MAERRMIHRKAAISADLADLREAHGGDAVAFYLLLVPFYDRYGCIPADPRKLRGMVVPLWEDVSRSEVAVWIEWMVERGMLVAITGPSGDTGLRNPSFEEHQRGTKFERETPSDFEPAELTKAWKRDQSKSAPVQESPDSSRTKSGSSPLKGRERKGSKTSPSLPSEVVESAGVGPELDRVAAQARPPEAEVNDDQPINGNGYGENGVDMAAIAAGAPPAIRDAIERARRKVTA